MAGVNKVIIIGNLGNNPEMRTMPNGTPVANISVATSETWTDKMTNERRERTEWHRIVLFRRLAEIAGEYLRKGSKVYVEGRLQTRKWQDANGQDRYTTEILGDSLQMLDSRRDGGYGAGDNGGYQGYNQAPQQQSYNAQPNYAPQQAAPAPRAPQQAPQPSAPSYPEMDTVVDDDIPF